MAVPVWRLDTSRFPLLVASVAGGDGRTPPELSSVTRILDEVAALRGKRAIVVDLTFAVPDASRRRLFIEWNKANWSSIRGEVLAIACVAPGAFQRSILTALLWFIQPACPIEVFDRRDAALSYALCVLQEKGLSAPTARQPPGLSA